MSATKHLEGYMDEIYLAQPSITTGGAILTLRESLRWDYDEARVVQDAVIDVGLATEWRSFCRRVRGEALEALQLASVRQLALQEPGDRYMQTKLPLPDADQSPVLADATLLQLRRSAAYLRRMQRTIGAQAKRIERLVEQLSMAVMQTQEPDLTVREAERRRFIDWAVVNAA